MSEPETNILISAESLTMAYGSRMIAEDMNFSIQRGDVLCGGGSAKDTQNVFLRFSRGLLGVEGFRLGFVKAIYH